MQITLNGQPHPLPAPIPLPELLRTLGFTGRPVLVELNHLALLSPEHPTTTIHPGDRVEVIQIVAGG